MIKAKMTGNDGREVVFLGLAFENLNRMREGQPILVRGDEMGLSHDIVLHAGKNEATILQELQQSGAIFPAGTIQKHPRCPDDDTDLLFSIDNKSMLCPTCDRQFGVVEP